MRRWTGGIRIGVALLLSVCAGCLDALHEPAEPDEQGDGGAGAVFASPGAGTPLWVDNTLVVRGSRAPAGFRVLGEFVAEFSPDSGLAQVEMLESDSGKSASRAVPGLAEDLTGNDTESPVEGRVRFLQDVSGNGQDVAACETFWLNGWSGGDPSWPFWVPAPGRADFLDDLAGSGGENRFCTNFRLINDVGRPLREVWIIVDGVTIPGARAWVQDVPRAIPGEQDGDPDILLEPNSLQGMFRYGDFEEDQETIGQWYFYLGGADMADFRVRGKIVEILRERCGSGMDDNGDGIVDSGCGTVPGGGGCFMNADCWSADCIGGVPGEPGEGILGTCAGGPPPLAPGQLLLDNAELNGTSVVQGVPQAPSRWEANEFEFDAYTSVEGCDGCTLQVALGLYSSETHHMSASNVCVELITEGDFHGATVSLTEGLSIGLAVPARRGVYELRAHVSQPDETCANFRNRIPLLPNPDAGTLVGILDLSAPDPACRPESPDIIISNLRLNGVLQETITVSPESTVQVQLNYAHKGSSTYCQGCVTPLTMNFNEQRVACVHQTVPPTSCPGTTGTSSFTVTAPSEPGTYPLYTRTAWEFTCTAVSAAMAHGRWNFGTVVVQ